ncbi:MAG: response regulator [Thermoanaerobaculia bacterium]|nr:response regulator [Thermoanaerobaculia bacterium]
MFRPRSSRPLILLVDDDPYQSEVASFIAEELDCDFESALSGTEALEKVARRSPDVVLLDVKMDDLSGYEVCRRIKTLPETADTQVLFVTARTEEEDLLKGFEALANDYLTKPFSARELKARTKNALRTKNLLDALGARTRFLELQQEITDKLEAEDAGSDDRRLQLLGPILDRISQLFGADGVTLHSRRPGRPETRMTLSPAWPGGEPPSYLAALALSEDPRVEKAPRLPGELRDPAGDWVVVAAPLWVGTDLLGTLRLHRRGGLPEAGNSTELEHLVALAGHLARTLHRADLIQALRDSA